MPDDKFLNLSQADEMVPMDTEGDGVEVALPEEPVDESAAVIEEVQKKLHNLKYQLPNKNKKNIKAYKTIDKLTAKLKKQNGEQAATRVC